MPQLNPYQKYLASQRRGTISEPVRALVPTPEFVNARPATMTTPMDDMGADVVDIAVDDEDVEITQEEVDSLFKWERKKPKN